MDVVFRDFQQAHLLGSGPLLASTLNPIAPADDKNRLDRIYSSSNSISVAPDVRSGLLAHSNTPVRFSKGEGNAWVDVYIAYWKVTGELVAAKEGLTGDWCNVYESWKEVTNSLIKGYSGSWFEAWTVPCLYIAGKYLRSFAIKADEYVKATRPDNFRARLQDDIAIDSENNEKLEDAARVINRIFTLCISDR